MARYRITFAKTEAMRFTGNLDVHRTWERMFRRAGLPLAYTAGFSPHPRLILAAALPLGCLSENDLLDVWLAEDLSPEQVLRALEPAAPPGLRVQRVEEVDPAEPTLPARVEAAEYVVELDAPPDGEPLADRGARLLTSPGLPRRRRGKAYDLRPLIEDLVPLGSGRALTLRLAARAGATGRPDEVLLEMGIDPGKAICRRTGLILKEVVSRQSSVVSQDP